MMRVGAASIAEAYRRPGLTRMPSRLAMDGNEDIEMKARVRVYRFGDHLQHSQGTTGVGTLTLIPSGERTEMDLIRGMLLRAAYGDSVDFEYVDYSSIYLYLLPDGEEINSPDTIAGNDKIVVFVHHHQTPFQGNIHDPSTILQYLQDPDVGPPITADGYSIYQKQRAAMIAALKREVEAFSVGIVSNVSNNSSNSTGIGSSRGSSRGSSSSSNTSRNVTPLVDAAHSGIVTGNNMTHREIAAATETVFHDIIPLSLSASTPSRNILTSTSSTTTTTTTTTTAQGVTAPSDPPTNSVIGSQLASTKHALPTQHQEHLLHSHTTSLQSSSNQQTSMEGGTLYNYNHNQVTNSMKGASTLPPTVKQAAVVSTSSSTGLNTATSSAINHNSSAAGPGVTRAVTSHKAPTAASASSSNSTAAPLTSASKPPISSQATQPQQLVQQQAVPSKSTAVITTASPSPNLTPSTSAPPPPSSSTSSAVVALGGAAASSSSAGTTAPNTARRLSISGNQKLRRAVHKLVLISRFNNAGVATTASKSGAFGGSSNSMNNSSLNGRSATGTRSRWGRRSIVGKSIDQYIKETSNIYNYNQQRRVMETDEKMPTGLFIPEAGWRIAWDVVILVLVIYFSVTVPAKLGFDLETTHNEKIFDYFSDCIFLIDIAINFMTTYKEDGIWVTKKRKAALSYATTWLPVDILSSFPIGWFTDNLSSASVGGFNKLLRMLRMVKLFRLLRLLKLFPKLFAMLETSVKIDPSLLRFLRSFVILLMTWHLMGCAYWFMVKTEYGGTQLCPDIANRPDRTCFVNQCLCNVDQSRDPSLITILPETDTSWYDPDFPDVWVPHSSLADADFSMQYMYSVYWSVAATTSIGINLVPRSTNEVTFTVVMIFLGLMMYSMIIGAASSALANIDSAASQRRQMLDNVLAFMRSRKVPTFFQKIIVDYYKHLWSSPATNTDEVLADLPATLRTRLTMIMNKDLVDRFPILTHMSADVYLRVVQRFQQGTYLPGEFIARQGENGDHFFLLKRGKVDAVLPNGVTVFSTFKPGEFFGEHSVLHITKRDASYRAVDFVDLLIMNRADFTELYISAPEFIREVVRVDLLREKQRLERELSVMSKKKGAGGDTSISAAAAATTSTSTTPRSTTAAGTGAASLSGLATAHSGYDIGGSGSAHRLGSGGGNGDNLSKWNQCSRANFLSCCCSSRGNWNKMKKSFGWKIVLIICNVLFCRQKRAANIHPAPASSSSTSVSAEHTTNNNSQPVTTSTNQSFPAVHGILRKKFSARAMNVISSFRLGGGGGAGRSSNTGPHHQPPPVGASAALGNGNTTTTTTHHHHDASNTSPVDHNRGPLKSALSSSVRTSHVDHVSSTHHHHHHHHHQQQQQQQQAHEFHGNTADVVSTSKFMNTTPSTLPPLPHQHHHQQQHQGEGTGLVMMTNQHAPSLHTTTGATIRPPPAQYLPPVQGHQHDGVETATHVPTLPTTTTTTHSILQSRSGIGIVHGTTAAHTQQPQHVPSSKSQVAVHSIYDKTSTTANSTSTRIKVSAHPGPDGYEPEEDFDLFAEDADSQTKKKKGLVRRISATVRNILPGTKTLQNDNESAGIPENPYHWKHSHHRDDSEEEDFTNVRSVVAEEPHLINLSVPEPRGRTVNGHDRRSSLKRPPTAELVKMSLEIGEQEGRDAGAAGTTPSSAGPLAAATSTPFEYVALLRDDHQHHNQEHHQHHPAHQLVHGSNIASTSPPSATKNTSHPATGHVAISSSSSHTSSSSSSDVVRPQQISSTLSQRVATSNRAVTIPRLNTMKSKDISSYMGTNSSLSNSNGISSNNTTTATTTTTTTTNNKTSSSLLPPPPLVLEIVSPSFNTHVHQERRTSVPVSFDIDDYQLDELLRQIE